MERLLHSVVEASLIWFELCCSITVYQALYAASTQSLCRFRLPNTISTSSSSQQCTSNIFSNGCFIQCSCICPLTLNPLNLEPWFISSFDFVLGLRTRFTEWLLQILCHTDPHHGPRLACPSSQRINSKP